MNVLTAVLAGVPSEAIDPKVTAKTDAPWLPLLRDAAGWVLVSAVIIVVLILIVGAVLALVGKLSSMSAAQSTGFMILAWGLLIAAVLGSISGLVFWATSQSLAPAAKAAGTAASVLGLVG